jgi:DDE superfamily endonuclease
MLLFFLLLLVTPEFCESIAKIRRKLQRIAKNKIIFLDETQMRLSDAPLHTLVLPGEHPYVITAATESYAPRYDMIASCTGSEQLIPIIYAPKERGAGINTQMLVDFIVDIWGQAVGALDRYPMTLVIDAASIHSVDKIREAEVGRAEIVDIIKMPAHAAKRLSPLDNALFHDWKHAVRQMGQLTASNIQGRMTRAWEQLPARFLLTHYHNCRLMRGDDVYSDCPNPTGHKHRN